MGVAYAHPFKGKKKKTILNYTYSYGRPLEDKCPKRRTHYKLYIYIFAVIYIVNIVFTIILR